MFNFLINDTTLFIHEYYFVTFILREDAFITEGVGTIFCVLFLEKSPSSVTDGQFLGASVSAFKKNVMVSLVGILKRSYNSHRF